VTNREFTATLAKTLKRPACFNAPAFALRLMLREMAEEMFLGSQRIRPGVALDHGFTFKHPDLHSAIADLLHRGFEIWNLKSKNHGFLPRPPSASSTITIRRSARTTCRTRCCSRTSASTPAQFWKNSRELVDDEGYDGELAYLKCDARLPGRWTGPPMTSCASWARTSSFYKGLPEMFEEMDGMLNDQHRLYGVKIEHYIVSVGLKALLDGSDAGAVCEAHLRL